MENISVLDAIKITKNVLENIDIPMKYKKQIADPVFTAIMNLNVVIDSMENALKNQEEQVNNEEKTNEQESNNEQG